MVTEASPNPATRSHPWRAAGYVTLAAALIGMPLALAIPVGGISLAVCSLVAGVVIMIKHGIRPVVLTATIIDGTFLLAVAALAWFLLPAEVVPL